MVRGPDGVPYVIDRSTKSVYRIDTKTGAATLVVKNGTKNKSGTVANPRYLAVGGEDLLILDAKNILWRWRPADEKGKGTLTKVILEGSASLGDDVLGINTFLRPGTRGLYNLYIVDPSEQQIRAYPPAADGTGFPAKAMPWLTTARDVSHISSTFVDGDIFVADGGQLLRFVGGKAGGWDPKEPKDTSLRPAPVFSLLASGTARREGEIYGFDKPNGRVIAFSKADGSFKGQYRLPGGQTAWAGRRAARPTGPTSGRCTSWRRRVASRRRSSGWTAMGSTRRSSSPWPTVVRARVPPRLQARASHRIRPRRPRHRRSPDRPTA